MSESIDSLKEAEKESMVEQVQPRQVRRRNKNTTGGLILIGIGAFFLLSQTVGIFIHNWWALFILIPAFHNLNEAWQSYRADGRLSSHARHSLMGGIFIGLVAAFFLFSLSWNLFWPIALIVWGVSTLINARS